VNCLFGGLTLRSGICTRVWSDKTVDDEDFSLHTMSLFARPMATR
jgi:hypothetical protein